METYINRFRKESPRLWSSFEQCTKEFQDKGFENFRSGKGIIIDSYTAKYMDVNLPSSYMVFFMFAYLKKFEYEYKPIEKVLYEIPFRFRGVQFLFTDRKFGLRLFAVTDDEQIIKDFFKKVNSAVKIVERMMNPLLKEIVNQGNITFNNQIHFFYERYQYFRHKVIEDKEGPIKENVKLKEMFFNAQAMLDAYFSYQEHLMILLLPFSKIEDSKSTIAELISKDWSTKFIEVFKTNTDNKMKSYFEKLKSLKERHRNKYAHGGFEKDNGSLYANVEGLGYIPVKVKKHNSFSILDIDKIGFTEMCDKIDEFESYLSNESDWRRPIKLLKSGLDIYFDLEHIKQYRDAIESDENLERYIDFQFEKLDREANMEW
ncbi:hypothetical protein N5C46_22910 [Rossellomorea vietnamensis]|uniref:Uncharacterized protein n=1 Tax=Rossellomorea vietnamensis TaxID=218284 RepID=A0ACD4C7M5_9BACI|nr:hypothetical protein [Rossellomorea vietnamensis]UXH44431.1 hypothetical protein N5C46_22910 [Rossellomorea vietnamensis]